MKKEALAMLGEEIKEKNKDSLHYLINILESRLKVMSVLNSKAISLILQLKVVKKW